MKMLSDGIMLADAYEGDETPGSDRIPLKLSRVELHGNGSGQLWLAAFCIGSIIRARAGRASDPPADSLIPPSH